MSTLRAVTINTGKCDGPYRARVAWLAEELAALAPDVVALQEAFRSADGTLDTTRMVVERLSVHAVYAPARFKTRWCEELPVAGWSGVALACRVPWQTHDILPLPADPRDGERVALLARTAINGRPLVAVSLHLTHLHDRAVVPGTAPANGLPAITDHHTQEPFDPQGKTSAPPDRPRTLSADELRLAQLRPILAHPWLAGPNALRLLCGDFNTPPDGPVLGPLLAGGGPTPLHDTWTMAPASGSRATLRSGQCVDAILVAGEKKPAVRAARVVLNRPMPGTGHYPSDHFGMLADIDFPEATYE